MITLLQKVQNKVKKPTPELSWKRCNAAYLFHSTTSQKPCHMVGRCRNSSTTWASRAYFSKALSLPPPPSPVLASSGVALNPSPSNFSCNCFILSLFPLYSLNFLSWPAPSFPCIVSTSFLVPLPPSHLTRTCWAPNSTNPSSNAQSKVQSKSHVLPQHNIPCSNCGDLFTHQGLTHHQRWCQAF